MPWGGWMKESLVTYISCLFFSSASVHILWLKRMDFNRTINISVWFLLHMVGSIAFADFIIWKFCDRIAPWNMDQGLWCVSSAFVVIKSKVVVVVVVVLCLEKQKKGKKPKMCQNSTASPRFGMYEVRIICH